MRANTTRNLMSAFHGSVLAVVQYCTIVIKGLALEILADGWDKISQCNSLQLHVTLQLSQNRVNLIKEKFYKRAKIGRHFVLAIIYLLNGSFQMHFHVKKCFTH